MSAQTSLFGSLSKLVSLVDKFRDLGLQDHIQLPRIAVCGIQSGGKSSLLQNVVGMDFLPRGSGVVTRTPLELRLKRLGDPNAKPYGQFDIQKGKRYFNFDQIRQKIQQITDKLAGVDKGIVDNPILLTVFSPDCPDLTLIDLPGITKVDMGQQKNIEAMTKGLMAKYCQKNERTIMLCVIPANVDLSNSDALLLARTWDPEGKRTIGCVTKVDIMDRGTDASDILSNKFYHLKLGYVAIKNRCQEDIENKVRVQKSLDDQEKFFREHPSYKNVSKDNLGTRALVKKLTSVLFDSLKQHLPKIFRQINTKIEECNNKLRELGPPLPKDDQEKTLYIWNMISSFADEYKCRIKGRFSPTIGPNQISGGALIKNLFQQLYIDQAKKDFDITKDVTDEEIYQNIMHHEGDSIPGFPSIHAFLHMILPFVHKLKQPALNLLTEVFDYLKELCFQLSSNIFSKFAAIDDLIQESIEQYLTECREQTKLILNAVVESETNYIFTNDEDYLQMRTKLFPFEEEKPLTDERDPSKKAAKKEMTAQEKKQKAKKDFILQMRLRVCSYYRIVVYVLRDVVPKVIGNMLVRKSQDGIQYFLYNKIRQNALLLSAVGEDPMVTQMRQTTKNTIKVLQEASLVIKKDFE